MHTQHIHNINSYMVASVTQVLFGRILSFQSSNCLKWVSPKQWTARVYLQIVTSGQS